MCATSISLKERKETAVGGMGNYARRLCPPPPKAVSPLETRSPPNGARGELKFESQILRPSSSIKADVISP